MALRSSGLPLRSALATAIAVVLALTACGSGAPTTSPTPPQASGPHSLADLTGTDWADLIDDVDCSITNMGVEVLGLRFADVRGVGVRDAFVWVDCVHLASILPHQLEVFDGSSPPANPRKIAVLQSTQEDRLIKSVSFSGRTVHVESAGYTQEDARCCPSLIVRRSFIWTGDHFEPTGS